MKTYTGTRDDNVVPSPLKVFDDETTCVTVTDDKGTRLLPPRLDLRNHSPTGFEWGYHGSGPAQLALAICADLLGDDARAQRVYQLVKDVLIAPIQADVWRITEDQVRAVIAESP